MNRKQSVRIRQASVSDIEALVPFFRFGGAQLSTSSVTILRAEEKGR